MQLSEIIKEVRQKSYMSQQEFADEIGVSFSTVNRWETAKAMPNYQTMKRLIEYCRRCNVDTQVLEEQWKENKNDTHSC